MYGHGVYTIASVLLGLAQSGVDCEQAPGAPIRLTPSEVVLPVDSEALDRQFRALSAMPSVKVAYSNLGLVQSVQGDTGIVLESDVRAPQSDEFATEVLKKLGDVLLATGQETLALRLNDGIVIKMEESIRGIPVLHGVVSLDVDRATGIVRSFGAYFLPDRGLPREPRLAAEKATALVTEMLEAQGIAKRGTVEVSQAPLLGYHGIFATTTRARLVWSVTAFYFAAGSGEPSDGVYWIDAIDGEYVGTIPYSVAGAGAAANFADRGAPTPAR